MRAIIQEIIDIFNRDYPTASDETYEFFHDVLNVLRNSKSEWVSVKDRLPDDDSEYLISMYHRFMIGGIYKKYTGRFVAKYYAEYKEWRIMNDVCTSVTHWMPLPTPPKEDDAE
jgi:hypothetical protein